MLKEFCKIEEEAHDKNLAVLAWVYPRGKNKRRNIDGNYAYAARLALEMGADIAKIKYCGSMECFKKAVEAAGKTKVVLSGGPKRKTGRIFGNGEKRDVGRRNRRGRGPKRLAKQ